MLMIITCLVGVPLHSSGDPAADTGMQRLLLSSVSLAKSTLAGLSLSVSLPSRSGLTVGQTATGSAGDAE